MPREIAVIGAGLVGCLWAVLLRRKGYPVTLYERRADLNQLVNPDGNRSINLVITSRGLFGLEQTGLLDKVLGLCVPVYGRSIHSRAGELTYQAYGQRGECNYSISRVELNRYLLGAAQKAGVSARFEHRLESIDFENKRLMFSTPQGSLTRSYDLLFGTDGAGSAVRRMLGTSFPSAIQEATQWLEADYKELLLPAGPNGSYALEKNALHIWPRGSYMLMALPNQGGSFTATLYLPKKGKQNSFEAVKTSTAVKALFQNGFPDASSLIPDYIDQFMRHPEGALGTVRCSQWIYQDSVALLGDAAHAIVPFFGQGMNCGFEDCTKLTALLDKHGGKWEPTLKEYDLRRRPNANAIADMALENWVEMRDKVGDPGFLLRKKVEAFLEERFPQVYKSRYAMITYTLIPYAQAQEAGKVQDRLLTILCEGIHSVDELSVARAESLLKVEYIPFLEKVGIHFF